MKWSEEQEETFSSSKLRDRQAAFMIQMKLVQVKIVLHKNIELIPLLGRKFPPVDCRLCFSLQCGHGLYLVISIQEEQTRPCIVQTVLVLKGGCDGSWEALQEVLLSSVWS